MSNVTKSQVLAVIAAYFARKPMPDFGKKTVEEIIAEKSSGMSERQLSQYWYETDQAVFNLLGTVDYDIYTINAPQWKKIARDAYPTLTNIHIPDMTYTTTDLRGIQKILTRDWTHRVEYKPEYRDCDDFSLRLYVRLGYYYGLTAIFPVLGTNKDGLKHAFNLAVLKDRYGGTRDFIARVIEPQTGTINTTHIPNAVITQYAELPG